MVLEDHAEPAFLGREVYPVADEGAVAVDSPLGSVRLGVVPRFVDPSVQVHAGALVAPMPGTVTRLAVEVSMTRVELVPSSNSIDCRAPSSSSSAALPSSASST